MHRAKTATQSLPVIQVVSCEGRHSQELLIVNRYDSVRKHSKRGGEYRWWDDGEYVDLDKLDLQSPADLQELRGKIEAKFDAVRGHLHYRMDQSNETDLSYQDSHHAYRLRLRHGYIIENEERTPVENSIEDQKQHWVRSHIPGRGGNGVYRAIGVQSSPAGFVVATAALKYIKDNPRHWETDERHVPENKRDIQPKDAGCNCPGADLEMIIPELVL